MLFSIFFLIFTYNSASTKSPRLLYQVYLDDQIIGKIESKKELESYFEKEGKKIKKTLLEYTEDIEKQEDIIYANGEKVFDICDDDVQEYCTENDIAFDVSGRII